jgi:PhnB protein
MKINPIPDDCHAITPYLTVPDAAKLMDFLKQAFGGIERARITRPDGSVLHGQIRIGDSLLMIGEPRGEWKARPCMLYHYVADVDASYRRALAAGAKSIVEPADMFYGDRHACVRDVASNDWWIASRMEIVSAEEIQKRAIEFYQKMAQPPA